MKLFPEKQNGLFNWMDLRTKKYKAIYWLMYLFLILMALVCVLPVIWVSLSGFKTIEEMYSVPPTLIPSSFDFSMIPRVWEKVRFGSAFMYSGIIMLGCVIMDVVFNGLAGFVLSKVKPIGSAILDTVIFWVMMMPSMGIVTGYMNMIDFTPLHLNLTGTFWPMWLGAAINAFHIFMFRNMFNSISSAYYEAAIIDGCSNLGAFFRVFIPLGKPTMMDFSLMVLPVSLRYVCQKKILLWFIMPIISGKPQQKKMFSITFLILFMITYLMCLCLKIEKQMRNWRI